MEPRPTAMPERPRFAPPKRSRLPRILRSLVLLAIVGAGGIGGLWWWMGRPPWTPAPAPIAPTTAEPARLSARGQVRPIGQARVGTLAGGVITRLTAEVGQRVEDGQELAWVRGPNGMETLTAPWRGTVMRVPVHLGDTVTPGTVLVTIGDLSKLRVETTDVDEFIIGGVRAGQQVSMTVEAVEGMRLGGTVRSVSLEPQLNETGDDHYPIIIDLATQPAALRAGMTVRIDFGQR